MAIYIILILILLFLNMVINPKKNEKNRNVFLTIAFILILIISCCRNYTVGGDTIQYVTAYNTINRHTVAWSIEELRFEPGYTIMCKLLANICSDPQFLIIMSSIFIFTSVYVFIKKNSEDVFLSTLLFILLNYFFMYMSAMRQALTISIILLGYTFCFKKDKKVLFAASIAFASLFHSSALIVLALVFLPKKYKYNTKTLVAVIAMSVIAYFLASKFFSFFTSNNKYAIYSSTEHFKGSDIAGYLNYGICLILLVFSYIYGKREINKNSEFNSFLFISSINLIFYSLSIKISIFTRITTYFDIFNCIYIPYVLGKIHIGDNRRFIKFFFYILIFLFWFIVSIYRPEWYGCIPYSFY